MTDDNGLAAWARPVRHRGVGAEHRGLRTLSLSRERLGSCLHSRLRRIKEEAVPGPRPILHATPICSVIWPSAPALAGGCTGDTGRPPNKEQEQDPEPPQSKEGRCAEEFRCHRTSQGLTVQRREPAGRTRPRLTEASSSAHAVTRWPRVRAEVGALMSAGGTRPRTAQHSCPGGAGLTWG